MIPTANPSIPAPESPGRPPKVLQVLPALVTGGVERGTADIAAALVRAGWDAIVASTGGPMVHEIERAGARHVTLPLAAKNPLTMRRNIARLRDLIEREQVDIVHARSRAPAWSAFFAARQTKRHFITTFHNTYGGGNRLKRFYNSIMSSGERVIAISEFVGEHAGRVYGVGPERLRVIPRGVDLARFDPETVSPSRLVALARAWRLKDDVPVVMLPGRVTRWKGHFDVIEAVARMERPALQVLFVGADEQKPKYRDSLTRRIEALGLGGLFHIVGDCRDMPAAFKLADVIISASTAPEGFGRVAVEAQAMGRPVIATDHGGSRETILDHETGWLVPPGDPDALAKAITTAIGLGPDERVAMAARARAWVGEKFDTAFMCDATLSVYEEVLFGSTAG